MQAVTIPDWVIQETGMFGMVNYVVSILSAYERNKIDELIIDFDHRGVFYEEERGPNWWEYYFAPIRLQQHNERKLHLDGLPEREAYFQLISKYVKFKPFLIEEANTFARRHFQTKYLIGIHFRGTDKHIEAKRTPYIKIKHEIDRLIAKKKLRFFKIFVATDESAFLDFICEKYPNRVITANAKRSDNRMQPLHFTDIERFERGKEAIIDCLLLSKCDYLIRTASNLSATATFINPKLPNHLVGYPVQY